MAEPSNPPSISQQRINSGGGDVAGGHIDKSQHVHFHPQTGGENYLSHLYDKLSEDIKSERKTQDTCEILNDFIATDEDEVVGLEIKLERGGMDAQKNYAKSCKERYVKNLTKYSMYETAQVIHAYFLGKVESGYATSVLPALPSLAPGNKFELMRKSVLDPIEHTLGKNPLGLHAKEIDGMAFFLTGKCKIKWEA